MALLDLENREPCILKGLQHVCLVTIRRIWRDTGIAIDRPRPLIFGGMDRQVLNELELVLPLQHQFALADRSHSAAEFNHRRPWHLSQRGRLDFARNDAQVAISLYQVDLRHAASSRVCRPTA